jgi:uncharacterized protein YjbJ (UPF0337 family)
MGSELRGIEVWFGVEPADGVGHTHFAKTVGRTTMNWDTLKGKWKQLSGKVKEKWGKLTDDDLTAIAGKRDQLVGKLQQRYGYEKQQAEKELDDFARTLKE